MRFVIAADDKPAARNDSAVVGAVACLPRRDRDAVPTAGRTDLIARRCLPGASSEAIAGDRARSPEGDAGLCEKDDRSARQGSLLPPLPGGQEQCRQRAWLRIHPPWRI